MLPINDLSRHNAALSGEIAAKVDEVIRSGWYVLGKHVKAFEEDFSAYCQSRHCVSVANGTDALELALRALGVAQGSTVITVANAGAYSTAAILAVGARPLFVDVDPQTLLMSVEELKEGLGGRIAAVIVTHLYGQAAPVDVLVRVADRLGIPVIEDCAQAHGAQLAGRHVGTYGAIGCFSFYPTKNLGAMGDGGAVITDDETLASRVRMLRQYGWQNKYQIEAQGGGNSRLDEIQAAILSLKLPYLENWTRRRYRIAERYAQGIVHPAVRTPRVQAGSYVGHLFVVRTKKRSALQRHLADRAIASDIHYPIPDYLQPALSPLFPDVRLKVTEMACEQVLTLPCFPEMEDEEVSAVISAVNCWSES